MNNRLLGLELLKGGTNGVILEYLESKLNGNGVSVVDTVKRTCKTPAINSIRVKMFQLKYYFLMAAGYWENGWTKWLDSDMVSFKKDVTIKDDEFEDRSKAEEYMRQTTIHKITFKNAKFFIGGVIDLNEKQIKPSYKPITEDDSLDVYYELMDHFEKLSGVAFEYMEVDRLPLNEIKALLQDMASGKEEKESYVGLTDEESMEAMMERLEEKGAIILAPPEMVIEKEKSEKPKKQKAIKKDNPVKADVNQEKEPEADEEEAVVHNDDDIEKPDTSGW